jgi:carboxyl-terminal processing protease
MYRPLIDWRGDFIPCMGAGPAAPAAIAFCDDHFKPFGFIKIGDYGITGFQLDLDNPDAAVIKSVDADSPAAKADIRPGDVITEVEGKPLTASLGESANQMLFGKTGVVLHLQVLRGNATQTFAITLADKAKK